jgi:NitT/TauT family transport system substrate-binding protein
VEYTVTDGTEETIYDLTTDDPVTIRVGSLKGPTSLGILSLMDKADQDQTMYEYEFQMASAADELLPLMIKGDLDIALVPANVASVLYNKTDGGICVIDINTLGVLYVVTGGDDVASIEDLKGKTIYLTGKGTTPEASLRYVLAQNGLSEDDYTLEFQSEATEVAAILAEDPDAIGLLPQPFVTAALMQNDALQVVLDLNAEWKKVTPDAENGMVTGVTVVRKEFYQEHAGAVTNFLEEHAASVEAINADPATGATLAVEAGIVAKEPIAEKAIPQCNLTCITGDEMEQDLSAYLTVLYDFNAELVGGTLPGEDFYTRVVEAN